MSSLEARVGQDQLVAARERLHSNPSVILTQRVVDQVVLEMSEKDPTTRAVRTTYINDDLQNGSVFFGIYWGIGLSESGIEDTFSASSVILAADNKDKFRFGEEHLRAYVPTEFGHSGGVGNYSVSKKSETPYEDGLRVVREAMKEWDDKLDFFNRAVQEADFSKQDDGSVKSQEVIL